MPDLAASKPSEATGAGAGMNVEDDLMGMISSLMGGSGLGESAMEKLAAGGMPEMLKNMDQAKLMQMVHSMIWNVVRSPVVERYLSDPGAMDELRMKLQEGLAKVKATPQLQAQLAGVEEFERLLSDPEEFRKTIDKVVEAYKEMPNPDPDGELARSFANFDQLAGLAKADDEVDDLDELPDHEDDQEL
jgi:hypothetical protein